MDASHASDAPIDWDTASPQRVVELCVNLDDLSGELIAAATEALMAAGALDVWTTPIGMKKGRPGVIVSVLVADEPALVDRFSVLLLQQTGSFGLRRRRWERTVLDRRFVDVSTRWGPVRVKVGGLDGRVCVATPEYDAVRALAASAGVPVREAMDAARAAAERWRAEQAAGGEA